MFDLVRRNSNNTMNAYNPFREMEEMERRFFGPHFDEFFRNGELAEFKTDVTDEGDYYLLEADLPGFSKEDIHLDLDNDTLTIRAERHSNVEKKEKHQIVRVERSYGSYSRSFDISGIETDGIKAKYADGVLQLTLPKKDEVIPVSRQIEIE